MSRRWTHREILDRAREEATRKGFPQPRTAEDVEALTGIAYNGPDPGVIGRTLHLTIRTTSTPRRTS